MSERLSVEQYRREVGLPRLLAVDPGCELTAWCHWQEGNILNLGKWENVHVGTLVAAMTPEDGPPLLVIEDIQSYGMTVGREVFRTAMWVGRFVEAWPYAHVLMPRRTVKLTLCGSSRAKDANVRQVVIDRLGEPPTKAKPNGKYPRRPVADEWSAIAIALTYEQLFTEGRTHELESL